MTVEFRSWSEANQRYLTEVLSEVREALERPAAKTVATVATEAPGVSESGLGETARAMSAPPALETLCRTFGLSPFERGILLLCAGVELDASLGALCATAQGDGRRTYPTFSLALAALPGPHWSALSPARPLRHWRLIEVLPADGLTGAPLRIDERILHYLAGASHPDERLTGLMDALRMAPVEIAPSHGELAQRLARLWSHSEEAAELPMLQLCGADAAVRRAVAAAVCRELGVRLHAVSVPFLPAAVSELDLLIRLWERESALDGCVLLVDCDDAEAGDTARAAAVTRLIERTAAPLIVSARERRRAIQRHTITAEVPRLTAGQQRDIWESVLGAGLNGKVEALVSQFSLSAPAIRAASAEALAASKDQTVTEPAEAQFGGLLWDACRHQARPRLDDLALRIEQAANWDDLVLPQPQRRTLQEIAVYVRHRAQVYETWGFAGKGARGLGATALFAGASGTGKTMAAEVLAGELRLDLYRIDLSSVVSKYIGETEKNLRRVFDAAEEGGAILLFDEADALFGKRSEVKDSHDRYANIEISYLLQRMEVYRGLAILTTNMKGSLDTAFLRRIRFVVEFPFPDASERAEIWRRVFPISTPTEGLDLRKLTSLNMAGGNIRNIALNAAFLAAGAGEPVRMTHLLRAARSECAKLERPLSETEVAGWA